MDVDKMTDELTKIFKLYDKITPEETIKEHIFIYLKVVSRASNGVANNQFDLTQGKSSQVN